MEERDSIFVTQKVLKKENRVKKWKKKLEKKMFKLNKLILYIYSNSFHFLYYI